MQIAIVGATGHVVRRALEQAAERGAPVTALVRHPEKLPAALRSSIRVEQGDLADGAYVARATRGADALMWLTPGTFAAPDLHAYTLGLAENAARAIAANGIRRVVFVSSHGADRAGLGQVSWAGEVERALAAAAPNLVALRSAGFMENLLGSLDALRQGQLFGVLRPDKTYPLVAARDVGDVAARWLLDASWSGHQVRGVHGPEDLSAEDQAAILGAALGRPVSYRQIPPAALRAKLVERGASASVADAYAAMFAGFAAPDYRPSEPRTAETTTATTLATFAQEVLAPRLD
ncbi:MAG: NAD(P)H-binding protein [Myxococcota bacterium]